MGDRSDISSGLAAKLAEITIANGYQTNTENVFHDEIPLGIQLDEYEVPALMLIEMDDDQNREKQCVRNVWEFQIQLWNLKESTNTIMNAYVSDVYKAIFAGAAASPRLGAFRDIHPSIYDIQPLTIIADVNTIETHRVRCVDIEVYYESTLLNI